MLYSVSGHSTKSINLNDELIVLAELLMSVITGPFTVIVIILTSHPLICTKTIKVNKGAKIRNRYNQVPHLTQDTNEKVTNSQIDKREPRGQPLPSR